MAVAMVTVEPMSRAIATRDRAELEKLVILTSRFGFVPAAAFAASILISGQLMLDLVFGAKLSLAYVPAVLLCAASALNARYGPASQVFIISGHQNTVLWFTLAGVAVILAGVAASAWAPNLYVGVLVATGATLASVMVRDFGMHYVLSRRMEKVLARGGTAQWATGGTAQGETAYNKRRRGAERFSR
jgi:O-antigen/teichoic acid export membrane protein